MKTITFPISDSLHKRFRNYCNNKDVNMKDILILAIEYIMQRKK